MSTDKRMSIAAQVDLLVLIREREEKACAVIYKKGTKHLADFEGRLKENDRDPGAVQERSAKLRALANSRIEAQMAEAVAKVETWAAEAQNKVMDDRVTWDTIHRVLADMPNPAVLVSRLDELEFLAMLIEGSA